MYINDMLLLILKDTVLQQMTYIKIFKPCKRREGTHKKPEI